MTEKCGYCCTKIRNINVSFGTKKVLENINIHIQCGKLNVIIGENVTTIQARAFNYCKKLKEIVLPKSIQEIGNQVFYKLEKLYYEGSLEEFNAINISDKNDVLIKLIKEDKIVYSYVEE